ncbi:hypothetical protein [Lysinibacillus cavernae]|uniref:hypothetical protein n=1 Tax=Lysinibacillus cavernae TaxID=2666135 RepID=UPI0012D96DED|nr:hypothetical protein [Lysinibacillus cavernae]
MRLHVLVLSLAFLLTGCSKEIKEEPTQPPTPPVEDKQPVEQEQTSLLSFFPPDGSIAYFQGEGNEFASFTLQTTYLDKQHIAQIEDNGGVTLLKIYRISDTSIDLVYREPVDSKPNLPGTTEAVSYPVLETILQEPLQAGANFQGWTIQSTTATVDTGTTVYQDVIQLTRTEDTVTTTKYFAKGIGLIRSEDTMETEQDEPFVVTSTLQKIE